MKAAKWFKEIEEAKKKLEEYRVPDTYHICSMPYSFMESIIGKLMGSIPINWILDWNKKNGNDYIFTNSVIPNMLEDWEKENE